MIRHDVIELIRENRSAHGVHQSITEEAREVFCTVQSVSRNEYYNAYNSGFQPSLVFRLELAEDYEDERYIRYQGKKYQVIRTYMTDDDGIEITVERSDENGES